jgi:tight adherence protein C
MLFLIALLMFAAVSLGAFEVLRPKPDVLRRRIGIDGAPGTAEPGSRTDGTLVRRALAPGIGKLGRLLARLLPTRWVRGVNRMLIMANEPWSLGGFLSTWALAVSTGLLLVFYIASSSESVSSTQIFGIAMLTVPFAMLIPYALLRNRVKKRQKAIVRALPDAMDLLVTSVEAGMGVDSAFVLVVEKTAGPLSETFSLYLRQTGLGRRREDALLDVAERTGVEDLIGIAFAVNQGEELGTPLGDVLRLQASELRTLRRQRAEAAAQRAPVLMTIPLALCFLPAMVAVVIVPSVMNLMRFVGNLGS